MTKRKIDQLTGLPPELVIWVNAETAAAMLDYAQEKFNEIRYSDEFKRMRIEQQPNRFSVELLRKFGRGEYR